MNANPKPLKAEESKAIRDMLIGPTFRNLVRVAQARKDENMIEFANDTEKVESGEGQGTNREDSVKAHLTDALRYKAFLSVASEFMAAANTDTQFTVIEISPSK